jgi:N-acetylneuraminic acid mutarotase
MSGSNVGQYSEQSAAYGTLGVPAPGNTPGVRDYALSWTDTKGNLWLFGGYVNTSTGWSNLNDLWKFDPATNEWAWMSGSSTVGSNCPVLGSSPKSNCGRSGTYGTIGTPAAGNTPGGRYQAVSWVDSSGNFWLYGGEGFDGAGNWGALSDLWRFNPSTNQWTWMQGSSTVPVNGCYGCILGQPSVPGTLGVPAQGNTPGGLSGAVTWSDKNGNLWLFGGWGYTPNGGAGFPNDLWEFNPSSNQWAWMGGDKTFGGSFPFYGTYGDLGKPAAGNFPGWRWSEATWTDANGNFWLFGGQGYAASGTGGILNDLWEFNPSTNMWAWMGGSSTLNCTPPPQSLCNQPGVYGTLGVPATGNIPGSRIDSFNWKDGNGNLWMFGGAGYDANNWNYLTDLWEFSPAENEWVWMGGSNSLGSGPPAGVYGKLGTPAPSNQPGGRGNGANWTDKAGNLWLFGGVGFDAYGTSGYLNDLWVYQLSPSFTVSGTPVSITAGATTGNASTITVTPTGGFTGSVALTAALTTSPSGAVVPPTFSFNSTGPLAIAGNAAGAGTLTIVTTAGSSPTCTSSNQIPSGIPWYAGSGAALASLFLFVIPKRGRTWRSMFSLVLSFVALVGGVVACSGNGGRVACPAVIKSGTTAGTYIITVTGTSGAITETGTVSITVQ